MSCQFNHDLSRVNHNHLLMSRGRSERKNNTGNYEMDVFGRRDPFSEMHQMMRGFGMGDDFFGGRMMGPFGRGGDPLEEMMAFSRPHQKIHGDNKGGSYVCQTFVSSSTMGPDGKMKQESYFENTAGQNKNGHTISQTKQAYKNNDGVKRIAEERMLNDRGHKVLKEQRRGGEVEHTNHYYNMDEQDVGRFHQDWGQRNHETKFLENVSRHSQQLPYYEQGHNRALGYEPRREQQPRREPVSYQPRREEPISYQRREEPINYQPRREEPRGLDYRPTGSRGSQASRQPSSMGSSGYRGSQYGPK